jgi:hypothetical protein
MSVPPTSYSQGIAPMAAILALLVVPLGCSVLRGVVTPPPMTADAWS